MSKKRKDKTLNMRISDSLSNIIDDVVVAHNFKNRSDFSEKAIKFYLTNVFNIHLEDSDFMLAEEDKSKFDNFVPINEKELVKQKILDSPEKTSEILDKYRTDFFMKGLEEDIEIKSIMMDGINSKSVELGITELSKRKDKEVIDPKSE